jgi:hypothetical protein
MTARTETQSIDADAQPDAVLSILADPSRIPSWAPAFADMITGDANQGWVAVKDGKTFRLRVVMSQASGTVDYLREIAPGREGGAYVRVLPHPASGSVIVMTLPLAPGGDRTILAATLKEELVRLVGLLDAPKAGR